MADNMTTDGRRSPWLPWPRLADDGVTPLGVDLEARYLDVVRIVSKLFIFRGKGVPLGSSREDYLQEVMLAIAHRNHFRSAHDPRKSSLGHYVHMVASGAGANLSFRERRHLGLESLESYRVTGPDDRPVAVIDRLEAPPPDPLPSMTAEVLRMHLRGALSRDGATYAANVLHGGPISTQGLGRGVAAAMGLAREEVAEVIGPSLRG